MSRIRMAGTSALALVALCAALARADDVSTKKLNIKDNTDPAKRKLQVQSDDAGVQYSGAVSPDVDGASVHAYSTTDDLCVLLPGGTEWLNTGTLWKFKSLTTKNSARIGDAKLVVKIKTEPAPGYTLSDNGTQGTVNVQVQFGSSGTRYCMRCSGNVKDNATKFLGKDCTAAACDAEPSPCSPGCPAPTTTAVKGSLTATVGRFNYNAMLGLPGANSACNTNFPSSHACTYAELQAAPASDLACLKDTASMTVTSFWAIDSLQPVLQQCNDDALGGSGLNWEYATAHTASRGQVVTLNNGTGALGSLQSSVQCNIAGTNWVGCCQ
jgi:hypothetical protein